MADFNSYLLAVAKANRCELRDTRLRVISRLVLISGCTALQRGKTAVFVWRSASAVCDQSFLITLGFSFGGTCLNSFQVLTEKPNRHAALFAIQALSREDRATVRNLFQRWPPI